MDKANLDWPNLDFGFRSTDYNIRFHWKDGAWSEGRLHTEETIPLHMASTCLHYGQECFEGLKAFSLKNGDVAVFRVEENAKRMEASCKKIHMQPVPHDMFVDAVKRVVNANRRFVPPYGSGAALYVRPLVIGIGPRIGVRPADEYMFIVFVTPVGPYFKSGFKPVNIIVEEAIDRAAPQGVGDAKVGGNYAAGMRASIAAREKGYTEVLYLDAKHKKFIDESGPANFFAIKDGKYITPQSASILPSITNMSLTTLAEEMGLTVERRQVPVEEIFEFEEAGCCGTAAVITPIGSIQFRDRKVVYGDGVTPGDVCQKLYKQLRSIQIGDVPDTHNWLTVIPKEEPRGNARSGPAPRATSRPRKDVVPV